MTLGAEKGQFRALTRLFAQRFLDTDIIQAHGDLTSLFSQAAALLAAFSFMVCVVSGIDIRKPPAAARWERAEFLISTAMGVIGLFTVILWDALFPDRRDALILGAMPVRWRTIIGAKIAAIGAVLALAVVSVNSFTGWVFPLFLLPTSQDAFSIARCCVACWSAICLASVFVFLALIAAQGLAIDVFPHATFQRISAVLQSGAFFGILCFYFLEPPLATPQALANPANAWWYAAFPPYWFLGLFEVLDGSRNPFFMGLAHRAMIGVIAAAVVASASFLLAYARQMYGIVGQAGISPRAGSAVSRLRDRLTRLVSPDSIEHALLAFTTRTLARSRQHRSIVAIFAGLGLAYALSGISSLVYSKGAFASERERIAGSIPLLMLFFLTIGTRLGFSIPVDIRANWLFQMTDPFTSRAYFSAARRILIVFGIMPVIAISAAVYSLFWPFWRTAGHLGFIAVLGLFLVEVALRRWDKIPFTCTYIPGKANLKVRFPVYLLALWSISQLMALIEAAALQTPAGYAVLMLTAIGAWRLASYQSANFRAALHGIRFEEAPDSAVISLGAIATSQPVRTAAAKTASPKPYDSILTGEAEPAAAPPSGGPGRLDTWGQDVRYGLRAWRKNPAFAMVALTVLATGIGANTIVFSIANAILFKNLPFKNSNRILYLQSFIQGGPPITAFSYPDFLDLSMQVRSFKGLAAFTYANVSFADQTSTPERYRTMRMSANGLAVMEQFPLIGRGFLPEDELPGAVPVAMLTYDLWQSRYGKDPAVLGRMVNLDEVPTFVIGVTGPGVRFPAANDLWMPLPRDNGINNRNAKNLNIFGMLADGATRESANTELTAVMARLERAYPATNRGFVARAATLSELLSDRASQLFVALMGAVGFVLLMACANVANLLLARGVGRSREFSIRATLGASRARILRQLLLESLLLAAAGGVLGLAFAYCGAGAFGVKLHELGATYDFSIDGTVLAYLATISLGSAILFGLAPALRASRTDLQAALKEGGSNAGAGLRNRNLSSILVSAEVAFAVVLLAGAGLMIRSVLTVAHSPIGVNTANVLTMRIDLPASKYRKADDKVAFATQLKARLESLPGVEAAAVASDLPGNGAIRDFLQFPFRVEHGAQANMPQLPRTFAIVIGDDYFRVMQTRLLAGREFTASDGPVADSVVIVNQSLASVAWPGGDPIGKRIHIEGVPTETAWMTVVGIAPDILENDFSRGEPRIYVPYAQQPQASIAVAARTQVSPITLAQSFRHAVQELDPNLPVYDLRTLDEHVELHHLDMRLFTVIFSIFGIVALSLASIGISGVAAHAVSQRTHEFGVRMALGASRAGICGLVIAGGIKQMIAGVAVGVLLALSLTRVLESLLVNTQANDPATFILAIALLAAGCAAGCAIPAWRAVRVNPVTALRTE